MNRLTAEWKTFTVKLSNTKGWNDIGLSLHRLVSTDVTLSERDCRFGYRDIVDEATSNPACQGYTGRHTGDSMGNFYGGTSVKDGASVMFYMFVVKPDWPYPS